MTISNFEQLSGDIVQRDMSLVWWAGITYILSILMLCRYSPRCFFRDIHVTLASGMLHVLN